MKNCPGCGQNCGPSDFGPNKSRYDGLQSYCKQCRAKRQALPESKRKRAARRYSISLEKLTGMEKASGGICQICMIEPATCIDHNHVTGEVRGLLCMACNCAIGLLRDNVETLRSAIVYLELGED